MTMMKPILTFTLLTAGLALAAAGASRAAPTAPAPDLAKGKAQFARCQACHSLARDVQRGIGPNLAGVVGRSAGKQPGYRYTPAMVAANFKWTPERLDAFLAKPRAVVPGTNMVFAGIPDAQARKALIAYMATSK
jgi:cytochrome c